MKVSVLIPTKNEPSINELIEEVHRVLKNFKHEIIVIDKSDATPNIKNAKLVIQKSDGLGNAILEGLNHANGDFIITMDGDGSHRPEDIPKLLEEANNFNIVIGSKYTKDGKSEDKRYRVVISKIFCWFASFILSLKIKDPMSGFAAVKKGIYKKIKLNPRGFKINLEILYKAKKKGFMMSEVPIIFRERKLGKSKARLKEGLKTIFFIFELRFGRKNCRID